MLEKYEKIEQDIALIEKDEENAVVERKQFEIVFNLVFSGSTLYCSLFATNEVAANNQVNHVRLPLIKLPRFRGNVAN